MALVLGSRATGERSWRRNHEEDRRINGFTCAADRNCWCGSGWRSYESPVESEGPVAVQLPNRLVRGQLDQRWCGVPTCVSPGIHVVVPARSEGDGGLYPRQHACPPGDARVRSKPGESTPATQRSRKSWMVARRSGSPLEVRPSAGRLARCPFRQLGLVPAPGP